MSALCDTCSSDTRCCFPAHGEFLSQSGLFWAFYLNRQTDKPSPFRQTPSHRKGEHSAHFLQRGVQADAVNPYKQKLNESLHAVAIQAQWNTVNLNTLHRANESAGNRNVYCNAETITAPLDYSNNAWQKRFCVRRLFWAVRSLFWMHHHGCIYAIKNKVIIHRHIVKHYFKIDVFYSKTSHYFIL